MPFGGRSARIAHALPLGDLHMVCDPYSSSTFDAGIAADVARDGSIAFIATSATSARELYYLPASSHDAPARLTHVNDFLSHIAVGRMSELAGPVPTASPKTAS